MVAAKLANLEQGRPSAKAANLPDSGVTQQRAAEMLNVSERTVRAASKVKDDGAPELVAAVESGKVSVSAAATLSEAPKERQAEIVAKGEKEILEAAKRHTWKTWLIFQRSNTGPRPLWRGFLCCISAAPYWRSPCCGCLLGCPAGPVLPLPLPHTPA